MRRYYQYEIFILDIDNRILQVREERLGAGRHARPHALLHPAEEEQAEEGDAGEAPGEL